MPLISKAVLPHFAPARPVFRAAEHSHKVKICWGTLCVCIMLYLLNGRTYNTVLPQSCG